MNLWPLIITFFIIGTAELGDKTQLLTLSFSIKYPLWEVLGAVLAATASLMALAVIFGDAINYYIPSFYIQLLAGIVFILFGFWTILKKEKDEAAAQARDSRNPFWIVFSGFFLAELGDKTQLATLALTAKYGAPFQVWLGATLGMFGINILAAVAGSWIKNIVSDQVIKWIGAALFIIFGLVTLMALR